MIPLRDCIRSRTYPYVNVFLIGVTLAVYLWEAFLPQKELLALVYAYGLVPARVVEGVWLPLLTSIFLHGGWVHVIGNMWYLWVFGDNVEDRLGHFRYLLFYLGAGTIGSAVQVLSNPLSQVPVVGASGAVAGVLGAYLFLFPRARIETLLILFVFITIVQVPAVVFIFFWFLLQLFNGVASLAGGLGQVAWWAHIGGFLGGIFLLFLLKD